MKMTDLGLSYEAAAHGVQSAVAQEMNDPGSHSTKPKHLRVGVDMSKADHAALAHLLIEKGVFTEAEYLEAMRLGANTELAMHERDINAKFPGLKMEFR